MYSRRGLPDLVVYASFLCLFMAPLCKCLGSLLRNVSPDFHVNVRSAWRGGGRFPELLWQWLVDPVWGQSPFAVVAAVAVGCIVDVHVTVVEPYAAWTKPVFGVAAALTCLAHKQIPLTIAPRKLPSSDCVMGMAFGAGDACKWRSGGVQYAVFRAWLVGCEVLQL